MKYLVTLLLLTLAFALGCDGPTVVIQGQVIAIGGPSSHVEGRIRYEHTAVAFHHDDGQVAAYNFCTSAALRSLKLGEHVLLAYESSDTCDEIKMVTQK